MTGLDWRRREEPLTAAAVGSGDATVAARLRAATEQRIAQGVTLRAVAGDGWWLVLGPTDDLPWADGAVYLGWDAGLLVPTLLAPTLPADMLRRALGAPAGAVVAVLPGAVLIAHQQLAPPVPVAAHRAGRR